MEFKEFMEAAAYNVGGGPKRIIHPPHPVKSGFDDTAPYMARIQQAKVIEKTIFQRLSEEIGLVIKPSSSHQDKYLGIDGFIVSKDGGKTPCQHIPVQIKARKSSSGNDILWETIKPWTQHTNSDFEKLGDQVFTGKDMKCQAIYLISFGNNGSMVRIRQVDEIKRMAKNMTIEFIQEYRATGKRYSRTHLGEARLVLDPSSEANYSTRGETYKINCFILPGVCEWKKDFTLKTPISL